MLSLASVSMVAGYRSSSRRVKMVRLLAAFVLASFVCGAVAEFTHSHNLSERKGSSEFGKTTESLSGAVETLQSGDTNGASSKTRTAADCLICQLHQNLSTTTFSQTLVAAAAEEQRFGPDAATLFHQADYSSNCRGRAPPAVSLS